MQFIDLAAQYCYLKNKIDARIHRVLDHGHYIMGPEVTELEEKLAKYVGVKHAITCANGTDALILAYKTLGIKKDDAIFCPTFTFFATAETISLCGATPIFVDANEETFNICTRDLEKRIEEVISQGHLNPKAIVAVDLFGLPANYPEIKKIADKYSLNLIEDAAQGIGGSINGKMAGSFGDISTTSFFPAKPLGCYGDGGAIFTDNDDYANVLKSLRVHGKGNDKYDNIRVGMNSRLDTIQAAILIEKLDVFPNELIKRNELANFYNQHLPNRIRTPNVPNGFYSSWAQYTVKSEERDADIKYYQSRDIPTMIYYKKCMHQQSAFKYLHYKSGDFPVAERLSRTVFSLPMHGYMSENNEILF